MQKSTKKVKEKAGKLKLKKWIQDRSIVSSIKQNFATQFCVIFVLQTLSYFCLDLQNWQKNFRFLT